MIYGIGSFLVIVFLWQLAGMIFDLNSTLYPSPIDVLLAMLDAKNLFSDIAISMARLIIGTSIGVVIGVACGLITGKIYFADKTFGQVSNFLRFIPPLALVPLFLIWFGIGEISKISLLFWTAFFPVWISTHIGIKNIGKRFILVAKSLKVNRIYFIKDILLKGSLTYILSGSRIGIGFGFSVLVASEMIGAYSGIGHRISMIGYIIVLGIIGLIVDTIFVMISKKMTPWRTHEF